MESFAISEPKDGFELIDMTKPLRPGSRSVLALITHSEMLKAMEDGTVINIEQHFN